MAIEHPPDSESLDMLVALGTRIGRLGNALRAMLAERNALEVERDELQARLDAIAVEAREKTHHKGD
jgi:regulator of replication initiation timing